MKRDNSTTRRFMAEAGIASGMHVLEIGCGGGEVTLLLAELVGPSGSVVALDHSEDALAVARNRMKEAGIVNVQLMAADIAGDLASLDVIPRGAFDALAGRRVLMYMRDPAEILRRLSPWLRGEGLVVFEEADSTMAPARTTPLAAHDKATSWMRRMLVSEGANPAMGFALPATLAKAGLRFERVRAEAVIQGQGTQFPLAALLKLMQSRVVAAGIASEAEVDALAARVDAERPDPTCVYVGDMSFCAWARKP
jgi:cyclopropane fatty-acyl-phospholipid synthase-like methyltransferase